MNRRWIAASTPRVKAVFSRRDPRDIAASIRKKWNKPFHQILSDVGHMLRIEQQMVALPGALIQDYRDLFADLPGCVERLGEFLSVPLTPQTVDKIAGEYTVGKVSERIARRRSDPLVSALREVAARFRVDPVTMMHDDHISASQGRDGDWCNCFSHEELEVLTQLCTNRPPSPNSAAA
jgi:hypothetical protein